MLHWNDLPIQKPFEGFRFGLKGSLPYSIDLGFKLNDTEDEKPDIRFVRAYSWNFDRHSCFVLH